MPFRTGRSFTGGMPRGLFGSIGLMAAHSSSVSSSPMIRSSQLWRLNHGLMADLIRSGPALAQLNVFQGQADTDRQA
jgi:hypothetical protein